MTASRENGKQANCCAFCEKRFNRRTRPRASVFTSNPWFARWCLFCAMVFVAGPPPTLEE